MITSSISHTPFAELQAHVLFFINTLAAVARYATRPPEQSELTPVLEPFWNGNRLRLQYLSDPFRMTALLKKELESFSFARNVQ
jgi:hypothetical protein